MPNDPENSDASPLIQSLDSEIRNAKKIPWCEMSEDAQAMLSHHWKSVEWYSRDDCAWAPNRVCPRQWNEEAYRLPDSVFQNGEISGCEPTIEDLEQKI